MRGIHEKFNGLWRWILQIPGIDLSTRNIWHFRRRCFKSAVEVGILDNLNAFHLASHGCLSRSLELFICIEKTPIAIMAASKYLNGAVCLPDGNGGDRCLLRIVVVVVVIVSVVVVVVVIWLLNNWRCFNRFVQCHDVSEFAVISMLAGSILGIGRTGIH